MSAIGVAAMIAARIAKVTCPHCRHTKLVERGVRVAYRVCPNCKKHFADPLAKKKR